MAVFDHNIFTRGAQMQQQSQRDLFDRLGGAIEMYQKGQLIKQEESKKDKLAALEPENVLRMKILGQQTTPEQDASLQAYDMQKQTQMMYDPLTKEPMPARSSIFDQLGGQPQHPQVMQVQGGAPSSAPIRPAPRGGAFPDIAAGETGGSLYDDLGAEQFNTQALSEDQVLDLVGDVAPASGVDTSGIEMNRSLEQDKSKMELQRRFDERKSDDKRKDLKEYSGEQLKASGFANRMAESESIIDGLLSETPDAQGAKTGFAGLVAGGMNAIPSFGVGDAAGDFTLQMNASDEQQQFLNAANIWIRANLRKESGAVISPDEMQKEYEAYFPIFGDKPGVIAQKARSRKTTQTAVQNESAGAYDLMYGSRDSKAFKKNNKQKDPLGLFK